MSSPVTHLRRRGLRLTKHRSLWPLTGCLNVSRLFLARSIAPLWLVRGHSSLPLLADNLSRPHPTAQEVTKSPCLRCWSLPEIPSGSNIFNGVNHETIQCCQNCWQYNILLTHYLFITVMSKGLYLFYDYRRMQLLSSILSRSSRLGRKLLAMQLDCRV